MAKRPDSPAGNKAKVPSKVDIAAQMNDDFVARATSMKGQNEKSSVEDRFPNNPAGD